MRVLSDPQIRSGYLIESPFDTLPEVTHCGEAVCVSGHALPLHEHPVHEFIVLLRGRVTWRLETVEFSQEAGDVFMTFPHQPHGSGSRPNPENQHLWIGVDLPAFSRRGRRLAESLLQSGQQLYPGGVELEPLLRGLISQAVTRKPDAGQVARCYLDTFVELLLQKLCHSTPGPSPVSVPRSLPIQRCLAFMEQHLDRKIALAELARIAAMRNSSDFCSRFQREVGTAPAALHLRMRLDAARQVLAASRSSITDTATQFGFSSSQHFSSAFKKAFALTPRAWREKCRA